MAEIDYQSVFTFLQEAQARIREGAPTPFPVETGLSVIQWLRNKASLDERASVKHFTANV